MGIKSTETTKEVTMSNTPTTLADFDEYGPNRDGECHYGACHQDATTTLAAVPYCDRHHQVRLALRSRLAAR